MIKRITLIFSYCFSTFFCLGQSAYLPLNADVYHLVERYEIQVGKFSDKLPTSIKPLQRKAVAKFADSVSKHITYLSKTDKFNLAYLQNDSWEWSDSAQNNSKKAILKKIYRKKSDFYHVQTQDFDLHLNPILHGLIGRDRGNTETPYLNTRGLELRGMIAKKVGFYTYFTDTQATLPGYATNMVTSLNAVPNEGYYKRTLGGNGLDFLTARGYFTFDILKDKISFQSGYDKAFLGAGYRSLFLSDYSSNYWFMKLNTNVWKLNYQSIFAQMTAGTLPSDGFYPQKFMALHHLSLNVTPQLQIGVFEAVVFSRGDTLLQASRNGYFDFRYLNPLIFYRSIEQQAGSPDNANIGFDFKWYFYKRFALYGQLMIDELIVGEIRKGRGWRGNKQAVQLGAKYINAFGVRNLDLQGELNIVRPYTYSHNFKYADYSNYNQALAHPLGANFREWVGIIRYQPFPRWQIWAKAIYAIVGADVDGQNWGSNIFKNNSNYPQEYGNNIGQGDKTKLLFLDCVLTFQPKHNIWIDIKQTIREQTPSIAQKSTTFFTSLALRWNLPARLFEF